VFEDGMGFERYVDYALGVPMYFVYRDGRYIDASGQSFGDFLDGRLPALPGERPTITDWNDHLTTLFPEVRLKRFLEMRGADGGPWRSLCALPALWVGLLYHQATLDAAWDLVRDWSIEEMDALRAAVPRAGLKAPFRGGLLHDVAREVLELAAGGLQARAEEDWSGQDERQFLTALRAVVESGRTPAEEKLDLFHGRWRGSVDPIFAEFAY
jgi:glutamate--cysteine ligase